MPDHNVSAETKKKKRKLLTTSIEDRTHLFITPSQANEDECVDESQVCVDENIEQHSNELSFTLTMTKEEVNDHVHKCLEMSSEGKITPKNAFALQLIDLMKIQLSKEDFSVIACTLEAGQKIYASRVDGLHQQVIKLAQEIINNDHKKKKPESENDETAEIVKKETRKAKEHILASAESLRRSLKIKDPKEKFIKFHGLPGSMMTLVKRDFQDLSFTMLNNAPFWHNSENLKPLTIHETVTIPHCEIYRNKSETRDNPLKNISPVFLPDQIETVVSGSLSASDEESEDMTDDLSVIDVVESYDDESEDNEVDVISTALKRLNTEAKENKDICHVPSRLETMKILFNQDSDYHYFNMEKAYYWSGPKFWKRSKTTPLDGKDKKKVTRKIKDPNPILYTSPDEKFTIKNSKRGTTVNQKTVMGWKTKNVTTSKDLKISVRTFLDLFHMPEFLEFDQSQSSSQPIEVVDSVTHKNNDDVLQDDVITDSPNSQDLLNSSFYENVPEDSGSSEHRDPLNSAFYDTGMTQQSENASNDGGKIIKVQFSCSQNYDASLVPVPNMVKFEPIKYKTKPIRVDMQHLKQTMWSTINENYEKKKQCPEDPWEDIETQSNVNFTDVLKELPSRLEKRTAEDLSTGMALMSLLTLANENNLQLKNTDDYSDVVISLEKSSNE